MHKSVITSSGDHSLKLANADSPSAAADPNEPSVAVIPNPNQVKAQRVAGEAEFLAKRLFSAQLTAAMNLDYIAHPESFLEMHDQLMEDAGNPSDPIERMQIEQLIMAHFRIGALHVQANQTESIEGKRILNGATARLMGEFRKLSIALRASRAASPTIKRRNGRLKIAAVS